jgi:hypothetical protein
VADLGFCTLCEQAPATTVWGFPVCQSCATGLGSLDVELQVMETFDPELAATGKRIEEAVEEVQRRFRENPLPPLPERVEVTHRTFEVLRRLGQDQEDEQMRRSVTPYLDPHLSSALGLPVVIDPSVPDPPGWRFVWPEGTP